MRLSSGAPVRACGHHHRCHRDLLLLRRDPQVGYGRCGKRPRGNAEGGRAGRYPTEALQRGPVARPSGCADQLMQIPSVSKTAPCARTAEYREEMQSRTPRSIPFSSRGGGGNTGGEEERNGEPGTTPRFLTSAPRGGPGPDLRRLVWLRQRLRLRLKRPLWYPQGRSSPIGRSIKVHQGLMKNWWSPTADLDSILPRTRVVDAAERTRP